MRTGCGCELTRSLSTLRNYGPAWCRAASFTGFFGGTSRYVETVCYTTTFLFHLILGFTETLTRLPAGAPIATSDQAPILQAIDAVLLVLFLVGLGWQILRLRASLRAR